MTIFKALNYRKKVKNTESQNSCINVIQKMKNWKTKNKRNLNKTSTDQLPKPILAFPHRGILPTGWSRWRIHPLDRLPPSSPKRRCSLHIPGQLQWWTCFLWYAFWIYNLLESERMNGLVKKKVAFSGCDGGVEEKQRDLLGKDDGGS